MGNRTHDNDLGAGVVFLLGAGRSGTTLLYKLLCLHPEVAFISNYENRLKWLPDGWLSGLVATRKQLKLAAWFNRGNAYFIRRPWIKKLVPTPVEGESVYADCGVPLHSAANYLPDEVTASSLRERFEAFRRHSDAKIFLSKRTANNRRLPILQKIFPQARYIHLIRDGRDVAHSLSQVEWWDDHVLWWDGRRAVDAQTAGEDRISLCARNWVHEMAELEANLADIPQEQKYQLRYEDLLNDPIGELSAVLAFIGLPVTADFTHAIEYLQLAHRPSRWPQAWSEHQLAKVLQEEDSTLRKLEYIGQ
jgi:hypothetical protein